MAFAFFGSLKSNYVTKIYGNILSLLVNRVTGRGIMTVTFTYGQMLSFQLAALIALSKK